jgi:hypothetical protein
MNSFLTLVTLLVAGFPAIVFAQTLPPHSPANGNRISEPLLLDYYSRPTLAFRQPGILVEPYDIIEAAQETTPASIETDR